MKVLLCLFACILSCHCFGQGKCGLPIDKHRILANEGLDTFIHQLSHGRFTTYARRRHIPPDVRRKLYCLFEETIANPNEKYQETDIVSDHLPWRRLIFFAMNREQTVLALCYRHGGILQTTNVILLKRALPKGRHDGPPRILDIWIGLADFESNDLQALIAFIHKHRYDENTLNTNMLYY